MGSWGIGKAVALASYTRGSGNSCCQLVPELYRSRFTHTSKIRPFLQPPLPPFNSVSGLSDTHRHLMGTLAARESGNVFFFKPSLWLGSRNKGWASSATSLSFVSQEVWMVSRPSRMARLSSSRPPAAGALPRARECPCPWAVLAITTNAVWLASSCDASFLHMSWYRDWEDKLCWIPKILGRFPSSLITCWRKSRNCVSRINLSLAMCGLPENVSAVLPSRGRKIERHRTGNSCLTWHIVTRGPGALIWDTAMWVSSDVVQEHSKSTHGYNRRPGSSLDPAK